MRKKDKDRLSLLTQPPASSTSTEPPPVRKPVAPIRRVSPAEKPARNNTLLERQDVARAVGSGNHRMVKISAFPTDRVRLWHGHNRDYGRLSAERCADLIEGFKRTGRQEMPAIGRKTTDDPEHDVEIVCGARRLWTATFMEWPLQVEVRDLSDRQAFILQDIENRDREDVSDYERAADYVKALPQYFNNSQSEMANFLEIDRANFNRLLELPKLPQAIVDAYADIRDLKTHHATVYKKLLAEPDSKRRVLDKAKSMKGQGATGKVVLSTLKLAATRTKPQEEKAATSRIIGALSVAAKPRGGKLAITLSVPKQLNAQARTKLEQDWAVLLDELSNE